MRSAGSSRIASPNASSSACGQSLLDDDPLEIDDREAPRIPVLGSQPVERDGTRFFGPGLQAALEDLQVTHVVVSFSTSSCTRLSSTWARRCQARGVTVSVLPRLFEGVTDDLELERIGGIPIVSVRPSDPQGWQYALKYASDRVIAALAIVIVSPILLVAALATLVTLGRPVLFRQSRVGLDGREFDVLKFRTMRDPTPDERSGARARRRSGRRRSAGRSRGADRRTRTGTFLRRSSIDEMPQLFNVVRGDMSLVGPRPERPTYVQLFDEAVYRYADRHRVKSGITGWSQVQGLRGNTSIADRVEWDNYYIENRSPWLDLKIILMTVPALLRDFGKPRSCAGGRTLSSPELALGACGGKQRQIGSENLVELGEPVRAFGPDALAQLLLRTAARTRRIAKGQELEVGPTAEAEQRDQHGGVVERRQDRCDLDPIRAGLERCDAHPAQQRQSMAAVAGEESPFDPLAGRRRRDPPAGRSTTTGWALS